MNCNASLNKFPFLSIVCFIIFSNHPFVNTRCELFRVQADLGMMDKFKISKDYELTGLKKKGYDKLQKQHFKNGTNVFKFTSK